MSDGGIGEGVSFWATINIQGDLKKEQLKAVLDAIRATLKGKVVGEDENSVVVPGDTEGGEPVRGLIKQSARLSTKSDPVISVSFNIAKNQ
jgi:hypothetical protein